MKRIIKKWYWILICAFVIANAILFFLLGENSTIAAHDNLDLFMPQYQMMKDTHTYFAQNAWVPFLGGASRDYLPSEFNVYTWLFMLMPGYYAYISGYLLKIIIAVAGSIILVRDIQGQEAQEYEGLASLCGFAYGILNLFPNFGLCFASIPLVVFILRKIMNSTSRVFVWYIALFFYPLLSYFSYFGIFIIGYIFLYFVWSSIRDKRFATRAFISMVVLSFGYVACEYRLFASMLFSDVESIRSSMVIGSLDLQGVLSMMWEGIALGDMHTEALQLRFVMPVTLIYAVIQLGIYIRNKDIKRILHDPLYGILAFILFNGVVYGSYYCGPVRDAFDHILKPLAGFQFSRTAFFNPFLWYVALFIVAKRLYDMRSWLCRICAYLVVLVSIMVTIITGTRYNDLYHTLSSEYHRVRSGERNNELTFREFYSEDLFAQAMKDINYQDEWSVAYGFYPAVLEYNGIRTLDGYLGYYPKQYKDDFRKIIAPSLERMPESAAYFDNWGSRCTLYSGSYISNVNANRVYDIVDEEIYIDIEQFKNMQGVYIFARMNITNAEEEGLELVGSYADEGSPYSLYVYRAHNT